MKNFCVSWQRLQARHGRHVVRASGGMLARITDLGNSHYCGLLRLASDLLTLKPCSVRDLTLALPSHLRHSTRAHVTLTCCTKISMMPRLKIQQASRQAWFIYKNVIADSCQATVDIQHPIQHPTSTMHYSGCVLQRSASSNKCCLTLGLSFNRWNGCRTRLPEGAPLHHSLHPCTSLRATACTRQGLICAHMPHMYGCYSPSVKSSF